MQWSVSLVMAVRRNGYYARPRGLRLTRDDKAVAPSVSHDLGRFSCEMSAEVMPSWNRRFSFKELIQESKMRALRFGRKVNLPSTIAIKHQFRTLVARREAEKAEAEGRADVFRAQTSPASVAPIAEIDASPVLLKPSPVLVERSGDRCPNAFRGRRWLRFAVRAEEPAYGRS